MQYIAIASLALATGVLANPLVARGASCSDNACLAAVTGKAALGDDSLRADHCKSYLATTVTPEAVTITTTITGAEPTDAWGKWKRSSVTVCPNEVPNYASACDDAGYSSACACFGYSGDSTTTLAPETSTKTVYVDATCTGSATATVTVTVGTASATGACPTQTNYGNCLTQDDIDYFTSGFTNLLENTGSNFNTTLAEEILAESFVDYSDSINYMANITLGTATFSSRAAFIGGQGQQQPISLDAGKTWNSCKSFTWRYTITPFPGATYDVKAINVMEVTDDLSQIQTNYAEFDNAAWLADIAAVSGSSRRH